MPPRKKASSQRAPSRKPAKRHSWTAAKLLKRAPDAPSSVLRTDVLELLLARAPDLPASARKPVRKATPQRKPRGD
jgi:hypothetical protein